jgi:hypothetical protein
LVYRSNYFAQGEQIMNESMVNESRDKIIAAFDELISKIKLSDSKIATKEQEAQKQKNQELLQIVSSYTIDNIINGLASLQLDFGNVIKQLADNLTTESDKLDQLQRAYTVESQNLEQLKKVRLVADALYIITQEHQEKLKLLENQTNYQREVLAKEVNHTEKLWDREQQAFTARVTEETQLILNQREREETDYQYETDRKRKLEMDQYEENKRKQERELTTLNQDKQTLWREREQLLNEQEQEFKENQQKILGFEEKLKEEYNKAKGEAIKEAEKLGKVTADLIEKEWEAQKQGYEFQLTSLNATIEKQTQQIAEITAQLQAATNQAQNLALRAFQSTTETK